MFFMFSMFSMSLIKTRAQEDRFNICSSRRFHRVGLPSGIMMFHDYSKFWPSGMSKTTWASTMPKDSEITNIVLPPVIINLRSNQASRYVSVVMYPLRWHHVDGYPLEVTGFHVDTSSSIKLLQHVHRTRNKARERDANEIDSTGFSG